MKNSILLFLLILLPFSGAAQTTSKITKKKPGTALLIVSSMTLVSVYSATIIADRIGGGKIDFPEVYIPAVGPIIAVFRYDSYVREDWPNQGLEKTLFTLSGIVQAASIVGIGVGAHRVVVNKKSKKGYTSYLSIQPGGPGGIKIVYNF
jgi:hypothetical protein